MKVPITLFLLPLLLIEIECGILDPRHATKRDRISLNDLWKFSLVNGNNSQYNLDVDDKDIDLMPVPASYNDIVTDAFVRDFVGVVRYQTKFSIPKSWEKKRVWLRFGSVCYAAQVYINDQFAFSHEIGHLPFVGEVTSLVKVDDVNDIVVLVDNSLSNTTIPQGVVQHFEGERDRLDYFFDFFHYAGIDRPVILYATENTYIDDITVETKVNGKSATVSYNVIVEGSTRFTNQITIVDKDGKAVASNEGNHLKGDLEIEKVNLWWPYLMDDNPGYLYTLKICIRYVDLFDNDSNLLDRYELPFGVRELYWDNSTFNINDKPVYLRGFGRHEDSDIRGKGLDLALVLRDHNLIRWIGANSYRTSHYPYAEEIMDLADSLGIMIIDEVPAVNTTKFNSGLLENHKAAISQVIARDKNRPSVIMWSAANEPETDDKASEDYYREVVAHLKSLDKSRPVTIPQHILPAEDYSGQFLDILSFNVYAAWYYDEGRFNTIKPSVMEIAEDWHNKHNKPVIVTEYGADTLEGVHYLPDIVWSEEYQSELISSYFEAFDELRAKGWFIGEMVWNFADFKTKLIFWRTLGNKKGIFTRQRQPKQSAHLIRKRYWSLASALDNAIEPKDLYNYIIKNPKNTRNEL